MERPEVVRELAEVRTVLRRREEGVPVEAGRNRIALVATAVAETPEEKASKIARVKSMYDVLGVPEDAKAEIVKFSDKALREVSAIGLDDARMAAIKEFTDSLVGRAK